MQLDITADEVHNYHVPAVKEAMERRLGVLRGKVKNALRDAHQKHHGKGESARTLAEAINRQFA